MPTLDVYQTDVRRLAPLFDPEPSLADCWTTAELGAVLRHQLRTPVEFDLGTPGAAAPRRLSFAELLHADKPALELLELTKQFAKAHRAHPESPLPDEVASVLYFGSILVARLRLGLRISELRDDELRRGLRWTVRQPWVEDTIRNLFQEGLRFLDSHKGNIS